MRTIMVCIALASCALAGETIPEVRTLDELRAAPVWTLSNRIEFAVTEALLGQRDHPEPPPK